MLILSLDLPQELQMQASTVVALSASGGSGCSIHERPVWIKLENATRVLACQRDNGAYKKNVILIATLCSVFGLLVMLMLWCLCYSLWYKKWKENRKFRINADLERGNCGEYVQARVTEALMADLLAGHITDSLKEVIADARARDGPMANSRFVAVYSDARTSRGEYIDDAVVFTIMNVQPRVESHYTMQ